MRETIEAIRVLGLWRVVYARTLYRPLSRLMHRFDLHYAPVGGPDGNQAWCQWCGLRYSYLLSQATIANNALRRIGDMQPASPDQEGSAP